VTGTASSAVGFLWEADGPEQGCRGVSGDELGARQAATECLRNGQATTARVEAAVTAIGTATLTDDYRRTGDAWQARLSDGRVTWAPVPRARLAAP
jgi:hypothetical protein